MMQIDRKMLAEKAAQYGFVRDTFEKVFRLIRILEFINADPVMKDRLALKGGTAINLTVFNLPRLSVDIDLDFCGDTDREGMLENRKQITEDIQKYMTAEGYTLDGRSKERHSLSSMIYGYVNSAGSRDNIKIEINYSMRNHILPLVHRKIDTGGAFAEFEVLSVAGEELFGSKIKALLDRAAPRDLYDVDNMIRYGLFTGASEREMLKKCALFYMAVGNREVPQEIAVDTVDKITWYRIRTDLLPVKKKQEKFDLSATKQRVKDYLSETMQMTDMEKMFLECFRKKEYRPEYLFEDQEITDRIRNHPMALWKMQNE